MTQGWDCSKRTLVAGWNKPRKSSPWVSAKRECTGKTEKNEDLPVRLDKCKTEMHWQNREKRRFASASGQVQNRDALAKPRKTRICQCVWTSAKRRCTGKTEKNEDLPVCLDKRKTGMHWQKARKREFSSTPRKKRQRETLAKQRKTRICQCIPQKRAKGNTGKTEKNEDLPVHSLTTGKNDHVDGFWL